MKQRYYIAPVIHRVLEDYLSSKLNDLINVQAGESFLEWHQDIRRYSLCLVTAEAATHTTIGTDPSIIVASPLFDNDEDRILKMNQIANINAVTTRLEAIGLNTEWLTGTETYKDIIRYIMRNYWMGQIVNGNSEQHMKDLILANLTTQVKDIPVATRTKIAEWMTSRGLATGWITGTTSVRQIVHYIVTNLNIKIKAFKDEF